MREQYIAEYQHNEYRKGEWCVATNGEGKRFFRTEAEARAAIQRAEDYFNNLGRPRTQMCGSIGITVQGDAETHNRMRIVKTRIRVRLVTDWETVEEECVL